MLDAFALQAVRYPNTFTASGVCAPSRSALIAGDWSGRAPGQPFFALFNIMKTHETHIWPENRESDNPLLDAVTRRNRRDLAGKQQVTDPAAVEVPPYLPDPPLVRADIARHYDNIAFAEGQVQAILERLAAEGLEDGTLVIVTTGHGDGFPRMKRTDYDSGIRVPMMVRLRDGRRAGAIEERLVSFVDLAPTIPAAARAEVPEWMQGSDFVTGTPRSHIFAAADRHDEVPGRSEAARDARFKYIRNWIARTGDLSAIPEAEMVARMWPGFVQPVTATPEISVKDGKVSLTSDTAGASIAYAIGSGPAEASRIYSGPFAVAPGMVVTPRAIRYGYGPSEVRSFEVP